MKKRQKSEQLAAESAKGSPKGILQYFRPCSKEEYEVQTRQEAERTMANWEAHKAFEEAEKERKRDQQRENATMRKRAQRARERNQEIEEGLRSPGGTKKRKVNPHTPMFTLENVLTRVPARNHSCRAC